MITSARRPFLLALALSAVLAAPGAAWSATATPVAPEAPDQVRLDARMGPLEMASVRRDGGQLRGKADQSSISADGRYVTYASKNTVVAGVPRNDFTQVLRFDRRTRTTVLVSTTPEGLGGDGDSQQASMSRDGRVVVFETEASDLTEPPVRTNAIVARDMQTGETTLVSQTPAGGAPAGWSYEPLVSADGSLVSFRTFSTDIVGSAGAVVFDRDSLVSTAVQVDTTSGPFRVPEAQVSGDGEWLTFSSGNAEIAPGDDNGAWDAFLMNRTSGEVTLVSRAADGTVADGRSSYTNVDDRRSSPKPFVSADGSTLVFLSEAPDVAGAEDPRGQGDLQAYAYDFASGTSELVTALPDGSPARGGFLYDATISPDGRYVAVSTQQRLGGPGEPSNTVFLRDLERGTTRAVSGDSSGHGSGIGGNRPHVAFNSSERLLPEDNDDTSDVYWRRAW